MARNDGDTRHLILLEAIAALRIGGHANLMVKEICQHLDVPASLVNYHFGNRDRLVAEATAMAYEEYVALNLAAITAAGDDPEDRVRAWIWAQFDWTVSNPGIAAILNYSSVAPGVGDLLNTEFKDRITAASFENLTAIFKAVREVHLGRVTDEIPTIEMMDDKEYSTVTGIIMWVTLGFSTWAAGKHVPTSMATETVTRNRIIENVVDRVIEVARGPRT